MNYTIKQQKGTWILAGVLRHKDGFEYEAVCPFEPSEDMLTAIARINEAHEVGAK